MSGESGVCYFIDQYDFSHLWFFPKFHIWVSPNQSPFCSNFRTLFGRSARVYGFKYQISFFQLLFLSRISFLEISSSWSAHFSLGGRGNNWGRKLVIFTHSMRHGQTHKALFFPKLIFLAACPDMYPLINAFPTLNGSQAKSNATLGSGGSHQTNWGTISGSIRHIFCSGGGGGIDLNLKFALWRESPFGMTHQSS